MTINNISADVRIVNYGSLEAFKGHDDIVVEERTQDELTGVHLWQRVMAWNSFSCDFAFSESSDYARNLARVRRMAEVA